MKDSIQGTVRQTQEENFGLHLLFYTSCHMVTPSHDVLKALDRKKIHNSAVSVCKHFRTTAAPFQLAVSSETLGRLKGIHNLIFLFFFPGWTPEDVCCGGGRRKQAAPEQMQHSQGRVSESSSVMKERRRNASEERRAAPRRAASARFHTVPR